MFLCNFLMVSGNGSYVEPIVTFFHPASTSFQFTVCVLSFGHDLVSWKPGSVVGRFDFFSCFFVGRGIYSG